MSRRPRLHHPLGALFLFLLVSSISLPASAAETSQLPTASQKPIVFAQDVQPILSGHCYPCHGPDKHENDLRLDLKSSALKGGSSGPAIIPGRGADSRLIHLVAGLEKGLVMPKRGPRLTDEQIGVLRAWIDQGADWPDSAVTIADTEWWSLKPLAKPAVPHTRNQKWARNPIDSFILAKQEEMKLTPSKEADRRTLIRRLTYDLTGLPPTPSEIELFLADKSPDAYERLVDRLLNSPRYGERWARHWLDTVHYADTHGHSQDRPRPNAWPYRDYVIRSFNQDKPFARFAQEQLAGDVLFPDDPDGIVALGFIAAGPWDDSSQVFITEDSFDKRQAQNLDRDDMVSTAINTFVSSTVHCARCHDHKFDPISQREYYGLQSIFAGVDRVDRPYDLDPKTNALRQALLREKTALDVNLKGPALLAPEIQAQVAAWEKETAYGTIEWTVLDLTNAVSTNGTILTREADKSLRASGPRPETETYTITAHTDLPNITAVRLEVLADENLPMRGPGREDNGNFALSEFRFFAAPGEEPTAFKPVALQNPTADYNQVYGGKDYDITKALDGDTNTSWSIYPEVGKSHFAFFELKENAVSSGGTTLKFVLEQLYKNHSIGRFRLSVTSFRRPVRVSPFPDAIAQILAIKPEQRTEAQRITLAAHVLKTQTDLRLAELPPPQTVYAVANDFAPVKIFKPAKAPRPIYILKRGDINKPSDELAKPGALSLVSTLQPQFDLADPSDEASRRAALAKWVTDPKNGLAWRSIVNRVWHYHFGRGIVDSPNDFGRMGSQPSHPELLDWLAVTFQESGGSFKALHKLIVMSATYRQSSDFNAQYAKVDSGNAYLWRMNRARLDAEQVRDTVLQLSGKLDLRMGGPPDAQFKLDDPNPPVTPVVDYTKFDVDSSAALRRGIYRYVYRTLPDPFMDALDCADASQLTPARNTSITAPQALEMLNNQFMLRQSEQLATRVAAGGGDLDTQITTAYQLIFERPPTRQERSEVKRYATEHGLANLCRILLNSNEFIFVN